MRFLIALLVLGTVSIGNGAPSSSVPGPAQNKGSRASGKAHERHAPRAPRCSLRVQTPADSAARRPRLEPFSAREAKDLRFDVWLRETQSSDPAEVRIYAPGGRLYRVLRVGPGEASISEGAGRGFSRRGLTVLSARMPLVGTHVTSRSLYGAWRVEAYFTGSDESCARPVDFVLEP